MFIRFTTKAGERGEVEVPNPPKSLDPRFDFVRSDEQLAAIENSRQTFAEQFLRHAALPVAFEVVAEFKVVADAVDTSLGADYDPGFRNVEEV